VADAQAGNGVEGVVLADNVWDWAALPVERKRVQVKQPHEQQDQVSIAEHFPEPLGFLEQMELLQTVGFPGPLEPVQVMASDPALLAFQAKAHQEVYYHSHQ
jgi:hypothetical protein